MHGSKFRDYLLDNDDDDDNDVNDDHADNDVNDNNDYYNCNSVNFQARTSRFCMKVELDNT